MTSDIDFDLNDLKECLHSASQIKASPQAGLEDMMISLQHKSSLLKLILVKSLAIAEKIKKTDTLTKMKKRINQTYTTSIVKLKKSAYGNKIVLKCLNTGLSWEEAYIMAENNVMTPDETCSIREFIYYAGKIQSEFMMDTQDLNINAACVDVLLQHFPIMRARKGNQDILIDSAELLLQKDVFLKILENNVDREEVGFAEPKPENDPVFGPSNRVGRKPLYVKFPSIIESPQISSRIILLQRMSGEEKHVGLE